MNSFVWSEHNIKTFDFHTAQKLLLFTRPTVLLIALWYTRIKRFCVWFINYTQVWQITSVRKLDVRHMCRRRRVQSCHMTYMSAGLRLSLQRCWTGSHSVRASFTVCLLWGIIHPSQWLSAVVWPCSLFCWVVRTTMLLNALFQTVSHYKSRYWSLFLGGLRRPTGAQEPLALALAWILTYASWSALDNQNCCQLVGYIFHSLWLYKCV